MLVGMRIFWRQLFSRLFGPFLRLTEYLISSLSLKSTDDYTSTGADQSSVLSHPSRRELHLRFLRTRIVEE